MSELPVAVGPPGAAESSDLEDQALRALAGGDRDRALTLLMSAYALPLYRYCLAMLRQPEMAEDVHQTVLLQAYQGLGRFGGRSSFRTWLFGIAHHRCLDALKAHRRRTNRFASLDDEPDRPGAGDAPEAYVAGREMAQALRSCLDALRAPVRAALLLRYHAGLSYVELESACGERAPTLQARVSRALPLLRRCLEERGVRP